MNIEFRGKSKADGAWHYGFYHGNRQTPIIVYEWETPETIFHTRVPVDPKTVGQYTNCTMHDGEKIYQGDIVKIKQTMIAYRKPTPFGEKVGYAPDEDFVGVVEFLEGMWVVNNRVDKMIPLWSETNEIEILGNIWDNPELLEVPE